MIATGSPDDQGAGRGRKHALNVPLDEGCSDETFKHVFEVTLTKCMQWYQPQAIMMVCGADGLANDPQGIWNLTEKSLLFALHLVLKSQLPTLVLGGGGYHHANTARLWAAMTRLCIAGEVQSDEDVPEHAYWHMYAPSFSMHVDAQSRPDLHRQRGPEFFKNLSVRLDRHFNS